MKLLYVAGSYRWKGSRWVPLVIGELVNIFKAWKISKDVWEAGFVAICPHTNSILMDKFGVSPQRFLEGDLEIVSRCDAVLMMPNWQDSVGAITERNLAIKKGIPVYHSFRELSNLLWD